MWQIKVEQANPFSSAGRWFIGGGDVFALMLILSQANPGRSVSLSGHARCRRVVRDGIVVSDFPDLSHWYVNVGASTQHRWAHGQELLDDPNE